MSAPHPTMAAMPFHFSAIEKSTLSSVFFVVLVVIKLYQE